MFVMVVIVIVVSILLILFVLRCIASLSLASYFRPQQHPPALDSLHHVFDVGRHRRFSFATNLVRLCILMIQSHSPSSHCPRSHLSSSFASCCCIVVGLVVVAMFVLLLAFINLLFVCGIVLNLAPSLLPY